MTAENCIIQEALWNTTPEKKCGRCKRLWKRRKWIALRHKYGIEKKQYQEMVKNQENLCAICKQPEKEIYRGEILDLSVDHNHETGKIRGLLCRQCNIGIGRLKENVEILQSAIDYLKLHS